MRTHEWYPIRCTNTQNELENDVINNDDVTCRMTTWVHEGSKLAMTPRTELRQPRCRRRIPLIAVRYVFQIFQISDSVRSRYSLICHETVEFSSRSSSIQFKGGGIFFTSFCRNNYCSTGTLGNVLPKYINVPPKNQSSARTRAQMRPFQPENQEINPDYAQMQSTVSWKRNIRSSSVLPSIGYVLQKQLKAAPVRARRSAGRQSPFNPKLESFLPPNVLFNVSNQVEDSSTTGNTYEVLLPS